MVTLITPTADRDPYLRYIHTLLHQQTRSDWEWWIYDTSYRPSPYLSKLRDRRVHYLFSEENLTIGEKRNRLIDQSKGEIIVHIDDDDYYSPTYLEKRVFLLDHYDFVSLGGWYVFDVKVGQGYYWQTSDCAAPVHYMLEPLAGKRIKELTISPASHPDLKKNIQQMGARGYGFSYLYHRHVWEASPFPSCDLKEDHHFFEAAAAHPFSIFVDVDQTGIVVKIVHDQNVSTVYPQFRIPPFLMERYLPHFTEMIDAHYPFNRD